MNTLRSLAVPVAGVVAALGFGVVAVVSDPRWIIVSALCVAVTAVASQIISYRLWRETAQLEARAAAWQERQFVIESVARAAEEGKSGAQWFDEYQTYVRAHAVAEGHDVGPLSSG